MTISRILEIIKNNKIALGTYNLNLDDESKLNLIKKAIKIGYRIIDTAENYENGKAEILIGKALKDLKSEISRDEFVIVSKVSPNHLRLRDVIKSAMNSCERLDTYIDIYMIHVPNPKIPLQETFKAFKLLQSKGYIKTFGISNFDLPQTLEATKVAKIFAIEHEFNFLYQYTLPILNFAKKNNIVYFAYRPFYAGEIFQEPYFEILKTIADKYNKTVAQLAIKWIQNYGAIPIVKSSNIEHLKENLDFNWILEKNDFIRLNELFKSFR